MRKNIKNTLISLATASMLLLVVAGCQSENKSECSDCQTKATVKYEKDYRYFDIAELGSSDKFFVASEEGFKIADLSNGTQASTSILKVDPAVASSQNLDVDLSSLTSFAVAKNELNSSIFAIGTYSDVYVAKVNSDGTLNSLESLEDNTTLVNSAKGITFLDFYENTIIIGYHDGRILIRELDNNGDIKEEFSLYERSDSHLGLIFMKDMELYKDKLLVAASNLFLVDYNTSTKKLENFTKLEDSSYVGYDSIRDIDINSNGLVLLSNPRGLSVGKIENGTFNLIKRYTKSDLPFSQYKTATFNSSGNLIAVGEMGKGVFVANIDSDGAISGVKEVTIPDGGNIRKLKFSSDDKYIIASTSKKDIFFIDVAKITGGE